MTNTERYTKLKDKYTEGFGEDLRLWKREYDVCCKLKGIIDVAYKVTRDKVKELKDKEKNNKK